MTAAAAKKKAEPNSLPEALVMFHEEITPVPKGSVNPHFKSNYADLAAVVAHIKPALVKARLSFTQDVIRDATLEAWVVTTVRHISGESFDSKVPYILPERGGGPQAHGSAQTYARRYGLMCALGVAAVEDDDDGNAGQAAKPEQREATEHPGSDPRAVRKMKARYEGKCPICKETIEVDAPIAWRKVDGTTRIAHWVCFEQAMKQKDVAPGEGPQESPPDDVPVRDYTQEPFPGDEEGLDEEVQRLMDRDMGDS